MMFTNKIQIKTLYRSKYKSKTLQIIIQIKDSQMKIQINNIYK